MGHLSTQWPERLKDKLVLSRIFVSITPVDGALNDASFGMTAFEGSSGHASVCNVCTLFSQKLSENPGGQWIKCRQVMEALVLEILDSVPEGDRRSTEETKSLSPCPLPSPHPPQPPCTVACLSGAGVLSWADCPASADQGYRHSGRTAGQDCRGGLEL